MRPSQGAARAPAHGPCAYLDCGTTVGEREVEDHEGPRLLGRGAAGGGVGQVDVGQRDPVCQGHFSGEHQDKVAISEALDRRWDKGGSQRWIRAMGLVSTLQTLGDGLA